MPGKILLASYADLGLGPRLAWDLGPNRGAAGRTLGLHLEPWADEFTPSKFGRAAIQLQSMTLGNGRIWVQTAGSGSGTDQTGKKRSKIVKK